MLCANTTSSQECLALNPGNTFKTNNNISGVLDLNSITLVSNTGLELKIVATVSTTKEILTNQIETFLVTQTNLGFTQINSN